MPAFCLDARRCAFRVRGVLILIAVSGFSSPANAQNAPRPGKWTIELYGGGSASSASTSGTPLDAFEPGDPFATQSGQISRAVSSWYFGDGAALLNQALAQISNISGTTLPRIVPLDAGLLASGGIQGSGGLFGLRVGRSLSAKLTIEFSVERSLAKLQLRDGLKNALNIASESFEAAFAAMLATAPANTITVDSQLTMSDASSTDTRIAGSAKWTVFSGNKIEAYVTGGGGLILNSGDGTSAILNGRYTFRYFGLFPMSETDRVVVNVSPKKTNVMGIVGGGLTYNLSSRTGLRADVRLLLNSTGDVTSLTAAPNIVISSPTNVMTSVTSPSLQFSNQPNVRSTLSGPNQRLTLFTGSGLSRQIAISLGIFKRF
jgi:hypothetical protein